GRPRHGHLRHQAGRKDRRQVGRLQGPVRVRASDEKMTGLLPVEEAIARLLAGAGPLATEIVPLAEAAGRVLTQPVTALRTQPPFSASAMDGYAVRAADVAQVPARLT